MFSKISRKFHKKVAVSAVDTETQANSHHDRKKINNFFFFISNLK